MPEIHSGDYQSLHDYMGKVLEVMEKALRADVVSVRHEEPPYVSPGRCLICDEDVLRGNAIIPSTMVHFGCWVGAPLPKAMFVFADGHSEVYIPTLGIVPSSMEGATNGEE